MEVSTEYVSSCLTLSCLVDLIDSLMNFNWARIFFNNMTLDSTFRAVSLGWLNVLIQWLILFDIILV